jgi:hypothetical protein
MACPKPGGCARCWARARDRRWPRRCCRRWAGTAR